MIFKKFEHFHRGLLNCRVISNKAWMKRHVDDFYVRQAKNNDLRSRSAFKFIELHEKHNIVKSVNDVVVDLGSTPGGWSIAVRNIMQDLSNKLSKKQSKSKSNSKSNMEESKDDYPLLDSVNESVTTSTQANEEPPANNHEVPTNKFHIYAIDLLPMLAIDDVHFIQGNFLHKQTQRKLVLKIENSRKVKMKATSAAGAELNTNNSLDNMHLIDIVLSDMLQNISGNHSLDHARSVELIHEILEFAKIYLKPNGQLLCKVLMGEDLKELMDDYMAPMFKSVKLIKPKASRTSSSEVYIYATGKK